MDMYIIAVILSGVISLFLLVKIWRSDEHLLIKFAVSSVTVIPVMGPVFYMFVSNRTPPQHVCLQDNGPRGSYLRRHLIMSKLYKRIAKEDGVSDEQELRN
ncbi:MAG: hypothetical protein MI864_15695 [Pseudomonadales bacterium]|nr:hypothetical protein [Pseudomonadales bacterium]